MRSASVCFWNHLYLFLSQKDDNAVIEMSLKLASIYATQNKWVLILCWESESSQLFDLLTSALFSNSDFSFPGTNWQSMASSSAQSL